MDLTSQVRRFIDRIDYEVDDLGYDVSKVLVMYSQFTERPGFRPPAEIHQVATVFHDKGVAREFEDALVIADYAVNVLYPSINQAISKLYYNADQVVDGHVKLTGTNRKIYCEVLMMVV